MCGYDFINNSWLSGILSGLISGWLVSILWNWHQENKKEKRHKMLYEKYEGNYEQYLFEDEKKEKLLANVSLERKKNNFIVRGKLLEGDNKGHELHGEIEMSESMSLFGVGNYTHNHLGGFYQVQILPESKKFRVYITYVQSNKEEKQLYIWIPVSSE